MQVPFICYKCLGSQGAWKGLPWAFGEIDDSGIHEGTCSQGHTIRYRFMGEPAHEILLDVGALAFMDGYFRESVSSFAAALEQSLEFYVEASLVAAGVERADVLKLLRINRFDQRRVGMVSACYLRDTGRQFPYLHEKRSAFRNRVIHNAYWPGRGEAADYCHYVSLAILGLYNDLGERKTNLLGIIEETADLEAAKDLLAGREAATPGTKPSFLDFIARSETFEEGIAEYAKTGWWKWPKPRLVTTPKDERDD